MAEFGLSLLSRWGNFYVITGSAAAALTGLQFVVIVLGAQLNRGSVETNRAFGTPTIVHFGTVLLIAALANVPWPSLLDLAFVLGLCGVGGLLYAALITRTARRQTEAMFQHRLCPYHKWQTSKQHRPGVCIVFYPRGSSDLLIPLANSH